MLNCFLQVQGQRDSHTLKNKASEADHLAVVGSFRREPHPAVNIFEVGVWEDTEVVKKYDQIGFF